MTNPAQALTPEQVIKRIAQLANDVAWQAGVGGLELAGQFVSILARHPDRIDAFLSGAASSLDDDGFMLQAEHGCLTFMSKDGRVVTPAELHAAREVQKIKRSISG